eukprot:3845621-Prymnesium_polylepis.1
MSLLEPASQRPGRAGPSTSSRRRGTGSRGRCSTLTGWRWYPEMTLVNGPGNGYDLVHDLMPLEAGHWPFSTR